MTAFTCSSGGDIKMCIYTITHLDTGRIYVGQTSQTAKRRWAGHCARLSKPRHSYIQAAIKKYGRDRFCFEVIDVAESHEQLDHKEKFWIERLGSRAPLGFNVELGGNGSGKVSQETKEKLRKANREAYEKDPSLRYRCSAHAIGKKMSDEQKLQRAEALREAHRRNPNLSIIKSERAKGVPRPMEVREKIRRALLGVAFTDERRQAIKDGIKPLELSDRIALARKRYKGGLFRIKGVVYSSPFEAEMGSGLPADQISTAIRRGNRTVKGVPFEVIE